MHRTAERMVKRLENFDKNSAWLQQVLSMPDTCMHCAFVTLPACKHPERPNDGDYSLTCEAYEPDKQRSWRERAEDELKTMQRERQQLLEHITKQHLANAKLSQAWVELILVIYRQRLHMQYGTWSLLRVQGCLVGCEQVHGELVGDRLRPALADLADTAPLDILIRGDGLTFETIKTIDALCDKLGYSQVPQVVEGPIIYHRKPETVPHE